MDYKYFLRTISKLILNPVKAWETIDSENRSVKFIRNNFLLPLIILVSVSQIAGSLIFTHTELSPVYSVFMGIRSFILLYLSTYANAFILGEITYPLDLGKDFPHSFRIIVFTIAPFLICQALSSLFESLLFVNVLGFYGLYLFWTGVEKLLNPPSYKKMPLLIATIVSMAVIYVITNAVLEKLIDKIYYALFS